MQYKTIMQSGVPQGRNGRHKGVVNEILWDVAQLNPDSTIKVPLDNLVERKENALRSQ